MQKTITLRKTFTDKFIGSRDFYRAVMGIAAPILVQNFISNFVGMLDNIMVGSVGMEQMTGVSVANQLFFVYNLCIFGGLSGAGIFTAQYFGKQDLEGIRNTVRYKLWLALILTGAAGAILFFSGPALLKLFLTDDGSGADIGRVLDYGYGYLKIILISLPAFALIQVYAMTLRECGETLSPMVAGIVSVLVNLGLNYVLIYGKLGLPALGVNGAAIATVIARYAECLIVVIWAHAKRDKNRWIQGLYRTLLVPGKEVKRIFLKGSPILLNELVWSVGMTTLVQSYSIRGITVVAAMNIANTIDNTLAILFTTMGSTVGIIIGQLLGAGKTEEAKDQDNKLIFFSIALSLAAAGLLVLCSFFFPKLYNATPDAQELASTFMRIYAIFCPSMAFMNAAYFTIRSGGKTVITFFFDSVSIWILAIPTVFLLCRLTGLSAPGVLVCEHIANLLKVVAGYILLRKNIWINNIVKEQ